MFVPFWTRFQKLFIVCGHVSISGCRYKKKKQQQSTLLWYDILKKQSHQNYTKLSRKPIQIYIISVINGENKTFNSGYNFKLWLLKIKNVCFKKDVSKSFSSLGSILTFTILISLTCCVEHKKNKGKKDLYLIPTK